MAPSSQGSKPSQSPVRLTDGTPPVTAKYKALAGRAERATDLSEDLRPEERLLLLEMEERLYAMETPAGRLRPWPLVGESGGWSVYRIAFDDGSAYVGITGRSVHERIDTHLGWTDGYGNEIHAETVEARAQFGTPAIMRRVAAGVACSVEIVASGLTRHQALDIERVEIAALDRPLNAAGPVRGWDDPLAPDPSSGAVARFYARINELGSVGDAKD